MDESNPLKARLRLEETLSHPRIVVHSGKLETGQRRTAVFDLERGCLVVGSTSSIHIEVVLNATLPMQHGRYLSGFVQVTEDGSIEWFTSGALSSFPPDDLPLPFAAVLDKIRGTGVRVPKHD